MRTSLRKMLALAGLQLLLLSAPAEASSPLEEKEKALVENMLAWAKLRNELRTNPGLEGASRETYEKQIQVYLAAALRVLEQLQPPFASRPTAPAREVFQFVVTVARKFSAEAESVLQNEFQQTLAEVTKSLLSALSRAVERYEIDKGTYPDSGNIQLLKEISGTYITLSGDFFDQTGQVIDQWGRSIVYKRLSSANYMLYSLGPDGKDEGGKGDDIMVAR